MKVRNAADTSDQEGGIAAASTGGSVQHITILASKVGRVIGEGGCNINAIRRATGATVDVDYLKYRYCGEAVATIRGEHAGVAYSSS